MILYIFPMVLTLLGLMIFWNNEPNKERFLIINLIFSLIYWGFFMVNYHNFRVFLGVNRHILWGFLHIFRDFFDFFLINITFYILCLPIKIEIIGKNSFLRDLIILMVGSIINMIGGTTIGTLLLVGNVLHEPRKDILMLKGLFFIYTISNITGALSSLGDPPLLLGLMGGVPFLWPMEALWLPTLRVLLRLMVIYMILIRYYNPLYAWYSNIQIKLTNWGNIPLIILNVLVIWGESMGYIPWVWKIIVLLFTGGFTLKQLKNKSQILSIGEYSREIFLIFINLFLSMGLLDLGINTYKVTLQGSPRSIFWYSFLLSGVLDNCPTYGFFFNLYGKSPLFLKYLTMGSVYGGALSPLGNAPNLLVLRKLKERKIHLPFSKYILYSLSILLPIMYLVV